MRGGERQESGVTGGDTVWLGSKAERGFVRDRREAEHRRWICRNLEWREWDNPRRKEWWGGDACNVKRALAVTNF